MEKTVFYNVSWDSKTDVKPDFLVTCAKQIKNEMDFLHPSKRFNYEIVCLPDYFTPEQVAPYDGSTNIIQMRAVEV